MLVELKFPSEFQGTVTGDINKLVFLTDLIKLKGYILGKQTPAYKNYL